MDIINVNDISFIYEDNLSAGYALRNVSMDIKKGEFVAILGHNGSGKSTIAKHFNALLLPAEGTVYVDNIDTSDHGMVWEIRKTAGMVFQNPDNQMIANIVEEEVAFGPENVGIEQKNIREYVDYALACVGMSGYAKKSPAMLSGGQKQRIAIAGILAMRPKIIVLDEPTAMLDPSGRKEVINTLLKLNNENDMTIILITHYMEEAVLADRVIVMDDGKKIMEGIPREVFKNVKELRAIGLDVPQVTEVAYLLSEYGLQISNTILTIEELVGEICRLKYEI